jgi:hypothetical protein
MFFRRRLNSRLHLESLETRALLAGDVDVVLSGDVLRLTGDKLANQVAVYALGADVVVEALDGTTLNNGTATELTFAGVHALNIMLAEANDELYLSDLFLSGRIDVNLGKGNDFAVLNFLSAHTALIDGSAGHDVVRVGPIVELDDTLDIELGPGNDCLFIEDFEDEGEGEGEGLVILENGGSEFGLLAPILKVDASKGDDKVFIEGAAFGAANIDGSDGIDLVCIHDSFFESLMVDLGKGNDTLMIAHTTVLGRAALNGSTGRDVFVHPDDMSFLANSFGISLISSFETELIDNELFCEGIGEPGLRRR